MAKYNIISDRSLDEMYRSGYLPQRNDHRYFYIDTSCRSNLSRYQLSSENRRIIKKTEDFSFTLHPIFFSPQIKIHINQWLKSLRWDFPSSSVKTIFTNHIFNQLYIWKLSDRIVAYSVCLFEKDFSHIAYVFYDPEFSHGDLPIRLVLQFVIDSHIRNLDFAYLGRFTRDAGYYKRNLPGFEFIKDGVWTPDLSLL